MRFAHRGLPALPESRNQPAYANELLTQDTRWFAEREPIVKNARAMASSSTNCPHCGARPRSVREFCEYCGGLLPGGESTTASAAVESHAQRFERLVGHPSFAKLLNQRPSAAGSGANSIVGAVFIAAFIVATALMLLERRPAGALILGPIAILVFAVVMLVRVIKRGRRLATSELVAHPAIVVGERTQVDGGGEGSRHTRWFVTLASRDGQLTELATSRSLTGRVTAGDIGVAYVKADHLIDFERVRA